MNFKSTSYFPTSLSDRFYWVWESPTYLAEPSVSWLIWMVFCASNLGRFLAWQFVCLQKRKENYSRNWVGTENRPSVSDIFTKDFFNVENLCILKHLQVTLNFKQWDQIHSTDTKWLDLNCLEDNLKCQPIAKTLSVGGAFQTRGPMSSGVRAIKTVNWGFRGHFYSRTKICTEIERTVVLEK